MSTSHDLVISSDRPPSIGELVVFTERGRSLFPNLEAGTDYTLRVLLSIRNFDDIERVFLKGAGLCANTYRAYLGAVKDFYNYSGGLFPTQVTPAIIECWYDSMEKRVGRATARLRVAGLKRFFAGVSRVLPGQPSPFDPGIMSEKLTEKLNRSPKGRKTKKALTAEEFKKVIDFLSLDKSEAGLCNLALCYMAGTSGLRASELTGLHWGDLDLMNGTWTARFTGKGDKSAEQELYSPAVESCRLLFRARYRREPLPTDPLFTTSPVFHQEPAQMTAHVFWDRVRKIGNAARKAGIVTRDLQWSPHIFRRTYASMLYNSGMGLKAIQTKTRHSSITTLTDHYIDDSTPATPFLEKALA